MCKPKTCSKGQISAIDVLAGLFIFLFIYLTLSKAVFEQFYGVESFRTATDMQFVVLKATEALVKTAGHPSNWEKIVQQSGPNCNNEGLVETIGLAKSDNMLSPEKVAQFTNCITYDRSRLLLNLDRFDYNFTLKAANGAMYSKGLPLTNPGKRATSIKRFVDFNGFDANLQFIVFEK